VKVLLQKEREVVEKTLRAEIARLAQVVQERESASAFSGAALQQATKEVESLKRQLEDVNRLLESERNSTQRLLTGHAEEMQALEVRR
jgi:anion-transporting  ArsA/GET3 family ATPase